MSSSLYGWQNFGGYEVFETGCSNSNAPADGTLTPTARAFEVASHFLQTGEHMVGISAASLPNVRGYASTYNGGYAVMLFNLSETTAVTVPVQITGKSSGTGGSVWTYDKSIYDLTKKNLWKGPSVGRLAAWSGRFNVVLPPWSMVVVQTK